MLPDSAIIDAAVAEGQRVQSIKAIALAAVKNNPDPNVAEAIRVSGARGVDTASGVESEPGIKDTKLIAQFVAAAKGPKGFAPGEAPGEAARGAARGDYACCINNCKAASR